LKTKIRNLLGGGVNLLMVIAMDFLSKDLLGGFDVADLFSDTGSDEPVLKPPVGAFHFPFGLWRQGIGDRYITILEDLLPLRGGLIGQQVVLSPEGVPALDKSEDGVGVYVVTVGESVLKEDALQGQDMSPGGFLFDQSGIEDQATEVIEGGDEIPLFLGCRSPEMVGGVVLDQLAYVTG
jgi:hypothetical protein